MLPLAHSQVNSKADCPGVKRMGVCRVVQETLVEMQDVWKIGQDAAVGSGLCRAHQVGQGREAPGLNIFPLCTPQADPE